MAEQIQPSSDAIATAFVIATYLVDQYGEHTEKDGTPEKRGERVGAIANKMLQDVGYKPHFSSGVK